MAIKRENHYTISILMNEDQVLVAYSTDLTPPTIFDRTGGYGRQAVPLILAWIQEEDTWLIGEEARTIGLEEGLVVDDLYKGVLSETTVFIKGVEVAYMELMALFLYEAASGIRAMNPNGIIEKVILGRACRLSHSKAVLLANQLEQLIKSPVVVKDAYEGGVAWHGKAYSAKEKLWVNYDRAGLQAYKIIGDERAKIEKVIDLVALGMSNLENELAIAMTASYLGHMEALELTLSENQMIQSMVTTYLPQLFIKEGQERPLKITFNHVFPPFQSVLSLRELRGITDKYYKGVEKALVYLDQTYGNYEWSFTGEMLKLPWVRQLADSYTTNGAYIQWAGVLFGLLLDHASALNLEYSELSVGDIGLVIQVGDAREFYPLIPWKEAMLGYQESLELMVEPTQERLTLVRVMGDGSYETVKEAPLSNYLKDTINHLVVRVTYDGYGDVNMTIERLTL